MLLLLLVLCKVQVCTVISDVYTPMYTYAYCTCMLGNTCCNYKLEIRTIDMYFNWYISSQQVINSISISYTTIIIEGIQYDKVNKKMYERS